MEEKEITVTWKKRAKNSLQKIYDFIAVDSPEKADKFIDKVIDFGDSLKIFPEKYPVCRRKSYAKRKYRCVTFDNTYVFVYKVVKKQLVIYNVIHGKRLG